MPCMRCSRHPRHRLDRRVGLVPTRLAPPSRDLERHGAGVVWVVSEDVSAGWCASLPANNSSSCCSVMTGTPRF